MSNVRDADGRIIGFRCHECSNVVPNMWGDICNACREKERRHQETLAATSVVVGQAYTELLMAVERKFPGESRHQTALRYIREAEQRANDPTPAQCEVVS
jgi:hypothetical protein